MTVALDKQTKVITGNAAAAYAALLCRPDVVAAYPITPQSEVIEQLAKFHADGLLDCQYVTVEGENSAQNVVCAATMAGGRAFTATSSYGLVYMYDAMFNTAGYRAPVVMINVNREPPGIHAVCSGQQDMISVRDTGWVQLIVENCQEILDTTIMAFRTGRGLRYPVAGDRQLRRLLPLLSGRIGADPCRSRGRPLPGGVEEPAASTQADAG